MREIKFRGKRIADGEWVYGLFYVINNNQFDVKRHGRKQSYYFERILGENEDEEGRGSRNLGEVYPATIEQYIGRHDRNGKQIYEGDILGCFDKEINKLCSESFEVVWDRAKVAFLMSHTRHPRLYTSSFDKWQDWELEVIGNIHDNPELMKGGDV